MKLNLRPTRTITLSLVGRCGTVRVDCDQEPIDVSLRAIYRGPPGPQGDAGPGAGPIQTLQGTAGAILGGHRVVGLGSDGLYRYVDAGEITDAIRVAGITTGAAVASAPIGVQTAGPLIEPGWTWTPDLPIYLGANGMLTQTAPASPTAVFSTIVALAVSATEIAVRLHPPTILF